MAKDLTVGFKIPFTIGNFVDASGSPAIVDPATPIRRLVLVVSAPGVAKLEADVDADTTAEGIKTFTLQSEDINTVGGIAVLSNVSADQLTGEILYQATEAVSGGITLGDPVPA